MDLLDVPRGIWARVLYEETIRPMAEAVGRPLVPWPDLPAGIRRRWEWQADATRRKLRYRASHGWR